MDNLSTTELELLKLSVDATKAGAMTYVPKDMSANLVLQGLVEINPAYETDQGTATRATQKGVDFLASTFTSVSTLAPVAATSTSFAIDTDIPLPVIKRNFKASTVAKFPFADLAVGSSFHVAPVDGKDVSKTMAAAVSNANKRYAVATGEQETVTKIDYKVDAKGKRVKENGKFVKLGEKQVTRSKMNKMRDFQVRSVDASDPRGAGVRVFRVK